MHKNADVNPFLVDVFAGGVSPRNSRADIKRITYTAARAAGWQVGEFHWAKTGKSYHHVEVATSVDISCVLLNHSGKLVALSLHLPEFYAENFVADDSFCKAIEAYPDMKFLPPLELEREWQDADVDWLSSRDAMMAYDLKYWKPETVGQILFNGWD